MTDCRRVTLDQGEHPMRIGVPDMISNSYFPAIAAVDLGAFKTEGLDAEIELLFPVPEAMEALRDGELDFVAGSAHAALTAFPDWNGAKLLVALAQHMYWFLVPQLSTCAPCGGPGAPAPSSWRGGCVVLLLSRASHSSSLVG